MKIKELFSDALPLIAQVAPSIGAALGNPLGFAAGYIIPILAAAFGAHPTDLKEIAANILSDPNAKDKLADIEHQHCNWLCEVMQGVDKLAACEVNVKLQWK